MAREDSGLGSFGLGRARENLGSGTQDEGTAYERAVRGNTKSRRSQDATEWAFPDSSRVAAYQYDYDTSQLRVRFHRYHTPWVYDGVPVTVFQAFDAAPSKGKYINSTLNFMTYRRATPNEEAEFFGGT